MAYLPLRSAPARQSLTPARSLPARRPPARPPADSFFLNSFDEVMIRSLAFPVSRAVVETGLQSPPTYRESSFVHVSSCS